MLIDVGQTGNLPYLPFLTETTHNDTVVARAQTWLDTHMSREVTIGALVRATSISESSLARRFEAAIGKAPSVVTSVHAPALHYSASKAVAHGARDLRPERRRAGERIISRLERSCSSTRGCLAKATTIGGTR
jgi:AraC-like DNA-binding protein